MKRLLQSVENLKKGEVKSWVDARIKEFKEIGRKSSAEIFKELCYCILTARFKAERARKIQEDIDNGFLTLPESQLAKKLKSGGHRFPNARAKYIVSARRYKNSLKDTINTFDDKNKLREWLARNIKGLGYKEASHFLRNIGHRNYAILDFHIIDILAKHKLIERPKAISKREYLKIEEVLRKIAAELNMTLAELDLYLWYLETGKVLK